MDSKALKGKNHEAVTAAALYIACRKENVPRTFKEICALGRASKKDIGRCYKLIVSNSMSLNNLQTVSGVDLVVSYCDCLTAHSRSHSNTQTRYVNNLGLSKQEDKVRLQNLALIIVEKATKLDCLAGCVCHSVG
jgi:transcription initiation factor TFIIIB Brf1 subunit/transcription initiation factor TFIIB